MSQCRLRCFHAPQRVKRQEEEAGGGLGGGVWRLGGEAGGGLGGGLGGRLDEAWWRLGEAGGGCPSAWCGVARWCCSVHCHGLSNHLGDSCLSALALRHMVSSRLQVLAEVKPLAEFWG